MAAADRARFIHLADVHLGYRQYGLAERARDFARAFASVIDYCLARCPDFVVIAGDLFDTKSIEPQTYADADAALARLADADIPVVAVEGNHERWYRRGERSWLWQLSRHRRLRLLRQYDFDSAPGEWQPWTSDRGYGAYTDIGPVRLFGVEYLGARLPSVLPEIAAAGRALPSDGVRFRVGLLHTAVDESSMAWGGGIGIDALAPLRGLADYLALGHVHYRYELPAERPWIFNPGSLEAHTVLEGLAGGDDLQGAGRARGIFDVSVDLGEPAAFAATFVEDVIARRPFRRVLVASRDAPSFEALLQDVERALDAEPHEFAEPPVVELAVRGAIGFDRARVDQARLRELVERRFAPLHARVRLDLAPQGSVVSAHGTTDRAELEARILRELIAESAEHGERAAGLAAVAQAVKAGAIEGQEVESLAELIEGALG